MAKIGTLWLRGGKWHGRQLVPKSYIVQAIQPHNQGPPLLRASYGYLWWVTRPPGEAAAYFAQGARGQYIYVVPAADIVIAIAADELLASGRVLINQVILPAMQVRNAH
jgi:CubicO group peptidase (beta-lactamase class C family)